MHAVEVERLRGLGVVIQQKGDVVRVSEGLQRLDVISVRQQRAGDVGVRIDLRLQRFGGPSRRQNRDDPGRRPIHAQSLP